MPIETVRYRLINEKIQNVFWTEVKKGPTWEPVDGSFAENYDDAYKKFDCITQMTKATVIAEREIEIDIPD